MEILRSMFTKKTLEKPKALSNKTKNITPFLSKHKSLSQRFPQMSRA